MYELSSNSVLPSHLKKNKNKTEIEEDQNPV